MKTTKNLMKLIAVLSVFTTSLNAQIFTLNGGYQSFPAQEAGTPDMPNGNVLVRKAPPATGNVGRIRQLLNSATIPDVVIQSRLTEGPLARYIAQMPAVISTANALNNRPNTANAANAIIINNTASLNANRDRIRNDQNATFIFRGNVNVNDPIVVGSNKTFWIDGVITYTGPKRPLANTDALSPIPIIRDGVFRIVRKRNVSIRGTKRGLVDCKSELPFAYTLNSREITIVDNEVINGFNTVFIHQTRDVTIENNFFYNNVRRAMHLIAVNGFSVKNNLCYASHLDGIDVDAFCQNGTVDLNVVLGATFRFMLWTEIDAHDNVMNNNVAIHLPGRRSRGRGGMQENGTENSRRGVGSFRGSRNNDWLNNHVFYPDTFRDGIVMRRDRFIQHSTIKFENNYVWTEEGNGQRHNPKPQNNNTSDVRFLTLNNPAAGTRSRPTNLFPNGGPEVLINSSPANLTGAQIRVTPGLFGGNSTPAPTPAPTPTPTPAPAPTPPTNGGNTTNLATGKTVSQSSNYLSNNDFNAQRAIDGDTNIFTHTNNDANAWWEIDLGNVSQITNIQVFNRADCCQNRLQQFHVLVSNNAFTTKNLNQTISQSGVGNFFTAGQAASPTNIAVNRSGRYVRIQLAGTNFLHIGEVRINGTANTGGSNNGGNNNATFVLTKRNAPDFSIDGNNGGANEQNVYLWSKNTRNVNQQWEEIDRGNGFYSYRKKNTNFCLDGGIGGANGQNVKLFTCGANNQNQHWRKVNINGNFRLEKRNAPGFSIDGGNGGAREQNVHLWTSSNTNQNQQWNFTSVSGAKLLDNNQPEITFYPNPAQHTVFLDNIEEFNTVTIYDMQGAKVLSKPLNTNDIDVSKLTNGAYILEFKGDTFKRIERIVIHN